MRDRILCFFFSLFGIVYDAAAQEHQRLIVVPSGAGITSFDPLTNRYRTGSLAAVAAFAEQWREELGAGNLSLVSWPEEPEESLGDRIYSTLVDSTLRRRMEYEAGYAAACERDSLLNRFGVTPREIDSLGETEWLVADRYEVAGQAVVRIRRQDFRSIRPSERFAARFSADEKRVRHFFLSPAVELDTTICARDGFFGPSSFADLFHRFQLETAPGSEVSIFAPPSPDAVLSSGPLTLGDVLNLFRFDNRLVTVRMTGRQLQEWMEKIFGMRFFRIEGPHSDLVRSKVPYYLHDDVAGLRFRVDLTARYHHRVSIYETERGKPFDPKRLYTVVLNSFRARDLVAMGLRPRVVATDYRLALARWLLARKTLHPRARDNWSAAPERWVRAIEARERRTIFDQK
ncbi:MAG: 5'-nucleotidase C-terminal domain-containing protein [Rikenella sp.]|nr:5'-nucleotidase C-terminal domain-containing protein [Rikenella sp.]